MNKTLRILLILGIIWIVTFGLKLIINDPRPPGHPTGFWDSGSGMPSQHTAIALALGVLIGDSFLTIALALAVGMQRLAVHAHTIPQVLVGGLIGYFGAKYLMEKIK